MINYLKKELNKLSSRNHVDKKTIEKFFKRLELDLKIVKDENPADHFCVFFLPINKKTNSVFLGHHIKADDWIPPGGHIEKGEFPLETVKREFLEELSYKLNKERIELFDLSRITINKPNRLCKIHYDLWYLVYTEKINFIYDKKEFYQAGWFSLEKGLRLMKTVNYNTIVRKLGKIC